MNDSVLWTRDPGYLLQYMDFYIDQSKKYLTPHSTDHTKLVIPGATNGPIPVKIGTRTFIINTDITVDTTTLDTGTIQSGKDYFVYAVDLNTAIPSFVVSLNSTWPTGDNYNANNTRKIGGFHTLCANVGTISGHALSGYTAGQVLPASIWCLKHRAANQDNRGLVYDERMNKWVQIYLASDDGASGVQSVYGATILDTITWLDFVDKGGKSKLRLLNDDEFQTMARGSNQQTNITGSSDPVTAGGHSDTASRRMISDIGVEDAVGAMWQWLLDQTYRYDMGASYITATSAGATATVYHAASPGGNPIYVKFDDGGRPYLCSNLATAGADKWVTLGSSQKVYIKHDANAETGGLRIYMNRSATDPGKLLVNNTVHGKNIYIPTNYLNGVMLQLVHDASASSNGVAVSYDDGADNRLEATFSNSANNTFDTCYFSPTWKYLSLPGSQGQLYKQGDYGDAKLIAGGAWNLGASCGSRARYANSYRWYAYAILGGRFVSEPL